MPARVPGYKRDFLDSAIGGGDWVWFGAGRENIAFARAEELSLFIDPPESKLMPSGARPRDVWSLKDHAGLKFDELQSAVWKEVWRGTLSADSFEALRKGLLTGFKAEGSSSSAEDESPGYNGPRALSGQRKRLPRVPLAIRERWKHGVPLPGRWFGLAMEPVELDEMDELDLSADRVRAIAYRYGIVARFLLERELPLLGWSSLFPAIRRLELAGELVSGHFFDGLEGPQFMAREHLSAFRDGAGVQGLWTVNACDPATPISVVTPVESWPGPVPSRVASTRITSLGSGIACVSRRSYRDLDIAVDPDFEGLAAILAFFTEARSRDTQPERRIILEKINGGTASSSPYAGVLRTLGFESDRTRLVLW